MLPTEFGPWQTVYFYFRKWKLEGVFEQLMHHLRDTVRKVSGKSISPSIGLIDSRSVRTSHHVASYERGIDGGKKVKGRKEHIIVGTLGLPMAAKVHAANYSVPQSSTTFNINLKYTHLRRDRLAARGVV